MHGVVSWALTSLLLFVRLCEKANNIQQKSLGGVGVQNPTNVSKPPFPFARFLYLVNGAIWVYVVCTA